MKLIEFKKKQKKRGLYTHFAVCWQTAKLPRGSYLCNLGHWLAYLVTLPSAGRRQRALHLCHLPADSIA